MPKSIEFYRKKAEGYWVDYQVLLSVHKVAELHGVSHSTIHRNLVKFGYKLEGAKFTEDEDLKIIEFYKKTDDFDLDVLTQQLGRPHKSNVSRRARQLGLTDVKRPAIERTKQKNAEVMRERINKDGHPKGYLGRKHSDETKKIIGQKSQAAADRRTPEERVAMNIKQVKTKTLRGNLHPKNRKNASWKQQWAEFGGKRNYYRSQWELNYARYLEMLKNLGEIAEWEHEPETFWFEGVKRGTVSYLPDFRVTENNGSVAYHEVKGWMDDKSKTKIRRMAKYHPDVKLIVIDSKAYKALAKQVKGLVDGWV